MIVRGDRLIPEARAEALRAYVHRDRRIPDDEWLRAHAFYVTRIGRLDLRYRHCEPDYFAEEISA